MTKVKHDVEVGLNRLYCGLRYANPGWVERKKEEDKQKQNEDMGEDGTSDGNEHELEHGSEIGDNGREGGNSSEDTEGDCTVGNEGNSDENQNRDRDRENENNKVYNHPMRFITSKFDKDIRAPYRATKDIEDKIKIIKSQLAQPLYNIKEIKIKKNFKKSEIESIKKIKEHNEAAIHFTDKTNKVAIVDKKLVEEKTLDHLRSSKFKEKWGKFKTTTRMT